MVPPASARLCFRARAKDRARFALRGMMARGRGRVTQRHNPSKVHVHLHHPPGTDPARGEVDVAWPRTTVFVCLLLLTACEL